MPVKLRFRECKYLIVLWGACIAIDLISKALATFLLPDYNLPRYNAGVTLSFFSGEIWAPYAFGALNIVVSMVILFGLLLRFNKKHRFINVSLILISAGALANTLDRIINVSYGRDPYVTDFIVYPHLFTGNIADIFIVVGAIGVALGVLFPKSTRL